MKKLLLLASLLILSLVVLNASNYGACAGCHGINGEKKALGKSAVITGWDVNRTIAALNGYKDGSYGGSMKGIMKGQVMRLSKKDIENLAIEISKFKTK
jgi:cytochrome c